MIAAGYYSRKYGINVIVINLSIKSRSCVRFFQAPGIQNHTLWHYLWCRRPFVDFNNRERSRPFTRVAWIRVNLVTIVWTNSRWLNSGAYWYSGAWNARVGVLPSSRLMGMCCLIGPRFHDCVDYYGVTFLWELLEWVAHFEDFGGQKIQVCRDLKIERFTPHQV